MTIEAIAALGGDRIAPDAGNGISPTRVDFGQWVEGSLARIGQSLEAADVNVRALAAGQDVPVHEVMISLERARMDLTLAAEVRNRLVEAYQELTRMQL
ncbi:MAG TPA: flagellar hook-basal body complex protein FliE [Lysobacter sp.]